MGDAVTTRNKVIISIILSALLAFLAIPAAQANVVVFERYDTTATIQGNTITIDRDVRIKNVGQTPIIPGEVHFRLYEQRGEVRTPIPVSNFQAHSETSGDLTTRVVERSGETDMSVHLWNPLLPNFHYDFTMSYEMEFSPSGILFYEIQLPREDTTIPIQNEHTEFVLDGRYSVTYAPQGAVSSATGNTVVSWDKDTDSRVVEYSRIPLPAIGVRAVNVFWLLIIAMLVGVFVMSLRRSKKGGGRRGVAAAPGGQQGYQRPPNQQQGYQQHPGQQPPQQGYQQYHGPR